MADTDLPPGKRQTQVAARRRELLEAAVNVVAQEGLTGVTMGAIAKSANCSFGTVAFHFKSKDGVIFAALDHAAEEYETFLSKLRETAEGPADRIRTMIEADFSDQSSGRSSVALWLAFWAEAVRVPVFRDRCAALREEFNTAVENDVRELAGLRGVTVDAEQVAISLNALVSGLWVESVTDHRAFGEGQAFGKAACLAFMRLHFPQDFP